jgi:phosphohistidine phosphatase
MKLWVIRHAKSSWADPGQADFNRPLNTRGIKDGKRMIRWMRAQTERPELIFSSDAARARATAEFVCEGFAVASDQLHFVHRIYEASAESLLDIVREVPDDCPCAALVGHNPGSTEFVNSMVGNPVIDNLPTFGVVLLDLPPRWVDARFGCAKFVALTAPKTLTD